MKWLQTRWLMPYIVILLGIGLRFLVAQRGYNYDFESFKIVLDIVARGGNVYAETARYNYGPMWFNLLFILDKGASIFSNSFRSFLIVFLSIVDLGIFFMLWRNIGRTTAALFFLNPVSIIITGYHNQFDNLAILLGMLAISLFGDDFDKTLSPKKITGLVVLGFSLMTKHILFVFPLWLAVKQKGLLNKAAVVAIPILVFILGFLPYWKDGQQGIVDNVLLYKSFNNQLFFNFFVPEIIRLITNSHLIWLVLLITFAIAFRARNSFNSLLLYTAVLVAASPAIANQYLAIPNAFIAANPNPFLLLYTLVGTWHLMVDPDGLHLSITQPGFEIDRFYYYAGLVLLLSIGFIWHLWRNDILAYLKKGLSEIKKVLF